MENNNTNQYTKGEVYAVFSRFLDIVRHRLIYNGQEAKLNQCRGVMKLYGIETTAKSDVLYDDHDVRFLTERIVEFILDDVTLLDHPINYVSKTFYQFIEALLSGNLRNSNYDVEALMDEVLEQYLLTKNEPEVRPFEKLMHIATGVMEIEKIVLDSRFNTP